MWISRWYFSSFAPIFYSRVSYFVFYLAHYKDDFIWNRFRNVVSLNHPRTRVLCVSFFSPINCHRYQTFFLLSTIAIIGWDLVFQITKAPAAFEQLTIFMSSLLMVACWTGRKHGYCCNRTNPQDFVILDIFFLYFHDNPIFCLHKKYR